MKSLCKSRTSPDSIQKPLNYGFVINKIARQTLCINAMRLLLFSTIARHNHRTHLYFHDTSQALSLPSIFSILRMHFTSTIVSAFVLGVTLLPTALAVKSPCLYGNNHNRGNDCSDEGWYACSHNLKHTVSYIPQPSSAMPPA
jgi:hypothetical protein